MQNWYNQTCTISAQLLPRIARRHINQAQKRELIADQLRATPELGDRHIASMLGVSHVTVSAIREELETTGQIDQLKKTVRQSSAAQRECVVRFFWNVLRGNVPTGWPVFRFPASLAVFANRFFQLRNLRGCL